MKTRGIIGRRITRISQTMQRCSGGAQLTVDYIELDNGVRLVPITREPDLDYTDQYGTVFAINKTNKKRTP